MECPPRIRPSALPALRECPLYSSDQDTNLTQKAAGTARHAALALCLRDRPDWDAGLSESDAAGVEWAAAYIRVHAPMADHPLKIEETGEFTGPDFLVVPGTPDVQCGPVVIDLKGRDTTTYEEQMAAYVLINGHDPVSVHVLYATDRRVAPPVVYTRDQAQEIVWPIIEGALNPAARPRLNRWCGWCRHRLHCPAVIEAANAVAPVVQLAQLRPELLNAESIREPAVMGECLKLARALKDWAEAVSGAALEMALKGVVPAGFTLQSRAGIREIADTVAAWRASGLEWERFLGVTQVRFSELAKLYAEVHTLKQRQAENDLVSRLGDVLQRRPAIHYLKATTSTD